MKVFDLLIWAIVSIVLVFLVIIIFNALMPKEDLMQDLKNATILAENPNMLGKLVYVGNKYVENDFLLSKTNFELVKRSMAIECTNPNDCCALGEKCSKIEWDYTYAIFKQRKQTHFYVRCYEEKISVCRIYFGKMPAQAEVIKVELLSKDGTNSTYKSVVKNTGEANLSYGEATIKLYKLVNNNWELTSESFPTQTINLLSPGQEHSFIWNIETKTLGHYRAEFIFSGNNSGYDSKNFDFNTLENEGCFIIEGKEDLFANEDLNKINERRYCTGCNYAYECLNAWKEKEPTKEWELLTMESTYYARERTFEEAVN